jgi:hypothetical protein
VTERRKRALDTVFLQRAASGSPVFADGIVDSFGKRVASELRLDDYEDVVRLLRSSLDNHGPNALDARERRRWEAAFEEDDEAFCHLFGPDSVTLPAGEWASLRSSESGRPRGIRTSSNSMPNSRIGRHGRIL